MHMLFLNHIHLPFLFFFKIHSWKLTIIHDTIHVRNIRNYVFLVKRTKQYPQNQLNFIVFEVLVKKMLNDKNTALKTHLFNQLDFFTNTFFRDNRWSVFHHPPLLSTWTGEGERTNGWLSLMPYHSSQNHSTIIYLCLATLIKSGILIPNLPQSMSVTITSGDFCWWLSFMWPKYHKCFFWILPTTYSSSPSLSFISTFWILPHLRTLAILIKFTISNTLSVAFTFTLHAHLSVM